MRWHWIIARPDELLLDLDSEGRLAAASIKLQRAVSRAFLRVKNVLVEESNSAGHYHVIVKLAQVMPERERILWQVWLGSDLTRELYNMMRIENGVPSPNLLIRKKAFRCGRRSADYICNCTGKHKGLRRCQRCPVMRRLHGKEAGRAYFPLVESVVRVKNGRLPIKWLKGKEKNG